MYVWFDLHIYVYVYMHVWYQFQFIMLSFIKKNYYVYADSFFINAWIDFFYPIVFNNIVSMNQFAKKNLFYKMNIIIFGQVHRIVVKVWKNG